MLTSPLSHSPLISLHLVCVPATRLPGHLSYLRSCQKAEKIWEDFKNLAEPASSRIILGDTSALYPKPQMFDFFPLQNRGKQEMQEQIQCAKNTKFIEKFHFPQIINISIFKF